MAKPSTICMLLFSRAAAFALTFAALQCYSASNSKPRLRTSAPDASTFFLCLQLLVSLVEFILQLIGLCIGFGPLPVNPLYRFCVMATDTVVAVLTSGATASLLGAILFLKDQRLINKPVFEELLWHGGLGVAAGALGYLITILNLAVAKQDF